MHDSIFLLLLHTNTGSDKKPPAKILRKRYCAAWSGLRHISMAATKEFRSRVKGSLVGQNGRNVETACSNQTTFTTLFHTAIQVWTWCSWVSSLLFQVLYDQGRSSSIDRTGCFEQHDIYQHHNKVSQQHILILLNFNPYFMITIIIPLYKTITNLLKSIFNLSKGEASSY